MEISRRSLRLVETVAQHIKHIDSVIEGRAPVPGLYDISASWRRSVNKHGVDPLDNRAPGVLTPREIDARREPVENLIHSARDEIDRLYRIVRDAGYAVLFCDTAGVAIEHRGDDADADRFAYWGTWLGGMWSEETEGTNGIGTCIAEERPVIVHRSQHFRSRHMNLSCSGAPIFGADGRLVAVLDVSTIDPEISERAHALTGSVTVTSAHAIEERLFREQFRRDWVLAAVSPANDAQANLLAVDDDLRIVGANRAARASLALDDQRLSAGVGLWSVFEGDRRLFVRKGGADIATRLTVAGGDETWCALVTPPDRSGAWRDPANVALHVRSRLDSIVTLSQLPEPSRPHGGLRPNAMRRVRDYVDAHLSETIDLVALATVAGLSVHHFAREFKQSAGVTPHHYVTLARVKRAQDMLAHTNYSLAEIAYAAGFTDQSHLTRHFRQMLGTTPRAFRWMQR